MYIAIEGLPGAGKSELLALLSLFYPQRITAFPELVKQVAIREGIEGFSQRRRLTEAILAELPRRWAEIEAAAQQGVLCIEQSHPGVHLAYSKAIGDSSFLDAYSSIENTLPIPDFYLRMEIPISLSLRRQEARRTPQFQVNMPTLKRMLQHLQAWHSARKSELVHIDTDRAPSEFLPQVEEILGLSYEGDVNSLKDTFEIIILLGRPAGGKRELIDFVNDPIASYGACNYV
ncbi:MAG: hypothetical protein U9Q23_01960 [Candidatus Bipolaricaulota bacterium]|nr:hypothetical protein [Candidatus Bipolaricaulota bacterium]